MDMITAADVARAVESYYEGGALDFISSQQWERAIAAGVDYTVRTPMLPPKGSPQVPQREKSAARARAAVDY